MANWLNTINIADVMGDDATPMDAAKEVASRLKALKPHLRFPDNVAGDLRDELLSGIDNVVWDFEDAQDMDDFNAALDYLYDIGDNVFSRTRGVATTFLWIETMTPDDSTQQSAEHPSAAPIGGGTERVDGDEEEPG